MPNQITTTGLTTKTHSELLADLTTAFQTIYGLDINLDSDTPDGQLMNIFIQAILDNLDLVTQVYNSFDPDKALGVTLDQRVSYNGIQRQAGTYTITNVTVVTTAACTLKGLDLYPTDPYTVSDNAGNNFVLVATQNPASAGTYVYEFRAQDAGEILTLPNTITVPVTIVLGVSTVNNPTTYTTLGINEESDASLKIRRQKSVSLASQGYRASLLAALNNINGITGAFVHENNTSATDLDGTPSHSIWVIASGGTNAEIADAIYKKRNAGCGMRGANSYTITQSDGSPFVVYWDSVVLEDLYIQFNASSLDGVNPPNVALILAQLPLLFKPDVYELVNINDLATIVQSIDPNTLVTGAGFCLTFAGTYTNTLLNSAKNKQFSVSGANTTITII